VKKTKLVKFENTAVTIQIRYLESTVHANLFKEIFSVPDEHIGLANFGSQNQRKIMEMIQHDNARLVV